MKHHAEPTGVLGCLVAVVAEAAGLGVWLHGAGPGVRGSFEGQRDWSLLYLELPLLLLALPALTVTAWGLTGAALRDRAELPARTAASAATSALTLALLSWAGLAWLDGRVGGALQGV
ncbi:hypothetical protein [Streptomyces xiaopingdaonensis]|uniref:hypothetical protein n=1 Tax=Streptomyces xiaopingdaonensis TaxID=1565415 RepID=UPI00031CC346|nr:hypothetical protein [Streptomyces xiaopingdaonensis]